MRKLLAIQTSLFGNEGQSSRLVRLFIENWQRQYPEGRVVIRDLASNPVPHLDAERFSALVTPEDERSHKQQAVVDYSDSLVEELQEADDLVLGVPMYNLDVPSTLRAYFDHIARAGVTFRYTENGPVGLVGDKPTYVVSTRGGFYGEEHSQTAYLKQFLGLIGITSIEFILAEGLNVDAASKERALKTAVHQIAKLMPAHADNNRQVQTA